jgi:hypothetical protein
MTRQMATVLGIVPTDFDQSAVHRPATERSSSRSTGCWSRTALLKPYEPCPRAEAQVEQRVLRAGVSAVTA